MDEYVVEEEGSILTLEMKRLGHGKFENLKSFQRLCIARFKSRNFSMNTDLRTWNRLPARIKGSNIRKG
jgi:hypothetical protein